MPFTIQNPTTTLQEATTAYLTDQICADAFDIALFNEFDTCPGLEAAVDAALAKGHAFEPGRLLFEDNKLVSLELVEV